MAEILKKITVKAVCGQLDKPEKATAIMTIFGLIRQATPDKSDYGDYVRFKGQFEAVDLETGSVYQSGTLILPEIAEGLLFGAVSGMDEDTQLQFALEIGLKPSKSPTGYDYTVKPLTDQGTADPLADLRAKLALPSPQVDNVAKIEGKK